MRHRFGPALAIGIASGLSPASAAGNWWTGNTLSEACEALPTAALDYAFGIMDGMAAGGATEPFCLPKGVVGKQVQDVICQYAARHPEERQGLASDMTIRALREAWPCK